MMRGRARWVGRLSAFLLVGPLAVTSEAQSCGYCDPTQPRCINGPHYGTLCDIQVVVVDNPPPGSPGGVILCSTISPCVLTVAPRDVGLDGTATLAVEASQAPDGDGHVRACGGEIVERNYAAEEVQRLREASSTIRIRP